MAVKTTPRGKLNRDVIITQSSSFKNLKQIHLFNHIALRKAKTAHNFVLSECNIGLKKMHTLAVRESKFCDFQFCLPFQSGQLLKICSCIRSGQVRVKPATGTM